MTYLPLRAAPNSVHHNLHIGTASYCTDCNAVVTADMSDSHTQFHKSYTNRKDGNMSSVLWCDPGNHAFKAGAPGSIHFQGTQTNDEGMVETATTDACADHNPMRVRPEVIAKELNEAYPTEPKH